MPAILPKIKVFKYMPELDAFDVTDQYREIADAIGISEWNTVVWIGRLFTMDNDLGEHWFDNWELREANGAKAKTAGYDADTLLYVDPDRFQDGRDGPCNTAEFRKRFWTDVLISLELDPHLLFDKARAFNQETLAHLDKYPDDLDRKQDYISDLEDRITGIMNNLSGDRGNFSASK